MESISRISNLLESARELTLDASSAARSTFRSPATRPLDARQIKKLLDSRNERDILDGLRRVIAMAYARNQNKTLPFFSAVVKNVASPNLEIKKLVYIYVVLHAEQEPDMALLSINTIQKSLSDANPQVRALALRTMSGIRVPVISQIVSLAIRKGTADMSPYVRRAAALAIPKCFRLDPTLQPQLLEHMAVLLGDKQYYVAGAAVTAFMAVCPDRIDLIHAHYRDLVRKLVDMDEWSQLATLRMMTAYARQCFPQRTKTVPVSRAATGTASTAKSKTASLGDFYGDTETDEPAPTATDAGDMTTVPVLDADLVMLLDAIRPLLQSRNAGVVVAVARCYMSVGTPAYVRDAVGPLVALLRGPQDIQQIALYNIAAVCLVQPADFVRYASRFLVRAADPPAVWRLKLEVLALVFPHSPAHIKSLILSELEHFARGADRDKALVKEAVRAIGRCAQTANDSTTSARCLRLLLAQITSLDGTLAAESLTVIRHLIQQEPSAAIHRATVVRLAKNLDAATDAQARATIVWLVGEFSGLGSDDGDNIAADVLRILLKDFANESEAAKRQILLLAAKVYLHHLNRKEKEAKESGEAEAETERDMITPLWEYVLLLVRYDVSYDLRDRARLYRALLDVPQLATLMLLAPKPVPHAPSPSEVRRGFTLGSAALVLGQGGDASSKKNMLHGIRGYESLPDWVRDGDEPDAALRDTEDEKKTAATTTFMNRERAPAGDSLDQAARRGGTGVAGVGMAGVAGAAGGKLGSKTLDDWLAEEEESSEEESEESEEESSEEEEEEEEEEEGDGDEEEEEEESEEESEESEEESDSDSGEADRLVAS